MRAPKTAIPLDPREIAERLMQRGLMLIYEDRAEIVDIETALREFLGEEGEVNKPKWVCASVAINPGNVVYAVMIDSDGRAFASDVRGVVRLPDPRPSRRRPPPPPASHRVARPGEEPPWAVGP